MNQDIIDRVHGLAQGAKQQWSGMDTITFESEPGMTIINETQIYNDMSIREEIVNEGHDEISERVAAAAKNINEAVPTEEEMPEEDHIDDSDSTFVQNDKSTDDKYPEPGISEVDSQDFEFNLANVHEIDDDVSSRSTDTSSLDTYVTESEVR